MSKKSRNEYVKSPITNRQIIVGGRVYNKLYREGYFQEGYNDDNILDESEYEENENVNLMKNKIDELNYTLPKNIRAVRGRGRYKNKIVKKYSRSRKQPKPIRQTTAEREQAIQILNELAELGANGDVEGGLAELIRQQNQQQEEEEDFEEVDYEDTEIDTESEEDYSDDDYDD